MLTLLADEQKLIIGDGNAIVITQTPARSEIRPNSTIRKTRYISPGFGFSGEFAGATKSTHRRSGGQAAAVPPTSDPPPREGTAEIRYGER
ncbi:hypothetical protein ACJRO7_004307 [Eucalyptus globulus]|uniref:Uncharacterized protein n=1 Tax=Eucalyptus globulus TaxID=34317 RepID=A0ABD3IZD1_EUCGL